MAGYDSSASAIMAFREGVEGLSIEDLYELAAYVREKRSQNEDAANDALALIKNRNFFVNTKSRKTALDDVKTIYNSLLFIYGVEENDIPSGDDENNEKTILEKALRDNRLWYDIGSWTKREFFGRLLALIYAVLCFLSIQYSLVGMFSKPIDEGSEEVEFIFDEGLVYAIAMLCAMITAIVNLKGLWSNVAKLMTDLTPDIFLSHKDLKDTPRGTLNKLGFYLLSLSTLLPLALLTTALSLVGVYDIFGIENPTFTNSGWIAVLFGFTFLPLWGLFSQEQRKWFAGDFKELLNRVKETFQEFMGLKPDTSLEKNKNPSNAQVNMYAVVSRALLFGALVCIASYYSFVVSDDLSNLFSERLSALGNDRGWSNAEGNYLSSWNVHLSRMFIAGAIVYAIGGSKKLADLTIRTVQRMAEAVHTFNWSEYHTEWCKTIAAGCGLNQNNKLIGLMAAIAMPFGLIGASVKGKVVECWQEAKEYAHQEKIKGSFFHSSINSVLRFLFLMLPLAVLINATNNGILFANNKRNAMLDENREQDPPQSDLTKEQDAQIALLTSSGAARSGIFGVLGVSDGSIQPLQQHTNGVVRFSGDFTRSWDAARKKPKPSPAAG